MKRRESSPRRGRRPKGTGNPRAEILRAAQAEFGRSGYDAASIRTLARHAGVNPALVYHYFRSKDGLFRESVRQMMRDPPDVATALAEGDGEIGTVVVRTFLDRVGKGTGSIAFQGLLRSASTNGRAAEILRDLISQQVTPLVSRDGATTESDRRVALAASALLGVGWVRYVIRLPGIADASSEEVARWLGPSLTRYLRDSLPD